MNDFSYDILDLLKKYDHDTNAALAGENCPQCLYAFSPLRENLFEWVEFESDARILQSVQKKWWFWIREMKIWK